VALAGLTTFTVRPERRLSIMRSGGGMCLTVLIIRHETGINFGHDVVESLNELWFFMDHIWESNCLLWARFSKGLNVMVAFIGRKGLCRA